MTDTVYYEVGGKNEYEKFITKYNVVCRGRK
jgi:hypothetical protein